MDIISSLVQFSLGTLGFLLLLYVLILKTLASFTSHTTTSKDMASKRTRAIPEPSGALPFIGHLHLLAGKSEVPLARKLSDIADKHGPIYSLRLGIHKAIVVSSWEIAKDCFTTHDKAFANRPSIAAGKYLGYNHAIMGLAPYGPYLRNVRKMVTTELLSEKSLDLVKHARISEVNKFITDLYKYSTLLERKKTGITTNISKLFENLTFNITLKMIVGKRYESSEYEEVNSEAWIIKKSIEESLHLTGVMVVSDAIPYLEWMDIHGHVGSMKRTARQIDMVIEEWLEEHRTLKRWERSSHEDDDGMIGCDFMDVMLSKYSSLFAEDAHETGHSPDVVIKATAMILILTGTESTAITLTWALSLLLNNPRVLKASQDEIDNKVGKHRWVEESDINNLNYLQAIIKETLRLYPPAPLTGIREVTQDCYINNQYYVKKGSRLFVNIWRLQRDPNVWSDPCEFHPERFMTTHAHVDAKGRNFEYIPFSSGRRSCPGYTFGLKLVHLTLARLLQGFDIKTEMDATLDMKEGVGIALPKVTPVHVVLKPRLPLDFY